MRRIRLFVSAAVAVAAAPTFVVAQNAAQAGQAQPAAMSPAAAARQMVLTQIADAERKFIALAEATPEDKFSWAPAQGVRTTGQVFGHIAGANYLFPRAAGVAVPDGITPQTIERTVTAKADLVAQLRASFAHARRAVETMPEAEMGIPVSLFGQQTTRLGVLVWMATHAHEHLGQSIAYARGSGVRPPWSNAGN